MTHFGQAELLNLSLLDGTIDALCGIWGQIISDQRTNSTVPFFFLGEPADEGVV